MFLKTKNEKRNTKKGFTLIEALTLLFIFSLITLTFYNVITLGTRFINMSKNRLGAVALANEKMEIIRNLSYGDVGTVGGVVPGTLPQEENVTENGKNYNVKTLVRYEQDPFDGILGGTPNDVAYKDYKTVKVTVSWNNGGKDQGDVAVVSRFVPRGLEIADSGDGILSINVLGEDGPVTQASVRIVNPDVGIDTTVETDDAGNVMLVGADESIQRYQLTVSKADYETVVTMASYPDTIYNPVDIHTSVIEGAMNICSVVQNKLSSIKVSTVDYAGNSVPNINFSLSGGRVLGHDVITPYVPIYNSNETDATDSGGEKIYSSISPGQYSFLLDLEASPYALIGLSPVSPFSLAPDSAVEINVKLAPKNMTGMVVRVKKSSDDAFLEGAEVKLSNAGISYDRTITTAADGLAFFPIAEDSSFSAGTYSLKITASGYASQETEIDVNEGVLSDIDIAMEVE